MVEMQYEGTVRLPGSVLVSEDALGETFSGSAGDYVFSITLPRLPSDTEEGFNLEPPFPDNKLLCTLSSKHDSWGHMGYAKVEGHPRPLASHVYVVSVHMTLTSDAPVPFYYGADQFGSLFDSWFRAAAAWIELWTHQSISTSGDGPARSRGQVWGLGEGGPNLTGWGLYAGSVTVMASKEAADASTLRSAFALASAGQPPPLEWLLYLQATTGSDRRTALTEAATAAEVGLWHALQSRLSNLPEGARSRIAKSANGLTGMVGLIEALDEVPEKQSRWKSVADRLAGPRNDAVHRGETPTADTLDRAIAESRALLDHYSPLPPPG
jgi:hypothetical protein